MPAKASKPKAADQGPFEMKTGKASDLSGVGRDQSGKRKVAKQSTDMPAEMDRKYVR